MSPPTDASGVPGLHQWLSRVAHTPSTAHEALAMAVHGLLVTHGFRPAEVAPSAAESEAAAPRMPAAWGEAGYGGRYRHARSAMTFDVRAVAVGPRLVVHATAVEDDEVLHTLELRVAEYVREGADFAAAATAEGGGGEEEAGWAGVFLRAEDLATLVQVNVAHRLVPDAAKDGYEAAADAGTAGAASSAQSVPSRDAEARRPPPPQRPELPDDDPLRVGPPRRPVPAGGGYGGYGGMGGGMGGGIGGGFGGDDLLAPGLPGGVGGRPAPGFGGGMGGNLMGPRHPGFGGGIGGIGGGGGMGGPFGGGRGGGLPPGVPPGARFDPYGPPDPAAGFGPRGVGPGPGLPGGRGGGRGGGPGSGVPDNDIELPAPDDDERQAGPGAPPPDMYW